MLMSIKEACRYQNFLESNITSWEIRIICKEWANGLGLLGRWSI